MSNPLSSVEPVALDSVLGGTVRASLSVTTDPLLQTLTSLSSTIRDIQSAKNRSGFSTTQVLLLGLLLNQNRGVYYW